MSSSFVLSSSFIKNLIIKASVLLADRNAANINLDALVYFRFVDLVARVHPASTAALSAEVCKVSQFFFTLRIWTCNFPLLGLSVYGRVHPFRKFKKVA